MIFQDGQAFSKIYGVIRRRRSGQPYISPRNPTMIAVSSPLAGRPSSRSRRRRTGATARRNRPAEIQLARRQICTRDRRRADASARQGLQHFNRSGSPRESAAPVPARCRVHRSPAAPNDFRRSQHRSQLRQPARRRRLRGQSSVSAKKRFDLSAGRAQRQSRRRTRRGPTIRARLVLQNVRLMQRSPTRATT